MADRSVIALNPEIFSVDAESKFHAKAAVILKKIIY